MKLLKHLRSKTQAPAIDQQVRAIERETLYGLLRWGETKAEWSERQKAIHRQLVLGMIAESADDDD